MKIVRKVAHTLNAGNSSNCSLESPSTKSTVTFESGRVKVDILVTKICLEECRRCLERRWLTLSIGMAKCLQFGPLSLGAFRVPIPTQYLLH